VTEVFGRYAGFTALLPTPAGAADRCVIPEHTADLEVVDVKKYYNTERLRPIYECDGAPLFIMTSDGSLVCSSVCCARAEGSECALIVM
jgi:6-phosphofructokinase